MTRRGWRIWAEAKCDGQTDKQTNRQGLLYIDFAPPAPRAPCKPPDDDQCMTEYTVKGYMMCKANFKGFDGVEVRVTLGRPLMGNLLIVFIPCIILLVICHLANVFERDYLDMVIGVNLTALLVLGTL